jgi:nitrogen regulatory protein PII 2
MKKIIAIIRNERVEVTKAALNDLGIKGATFLHVTGRGMPEGLSPARSLSGERPVTLRTPEEWRDGLSVPKDATIPTSLPRTKRGLAGFLSQRMLIIVAQDNDVRSIIDTLVAANKTGHHGDGKIFVCPMISAIRVRNGEQGDRALI